MASREGGLERRAQGPGVSGDENTGTQSRGPREAGGRDGRDMVTRPGRPGCRNLGGAAGALPELRGSMAITLVSDFWRPKPENKLM